jgi:uncharacterized protein (TIGR02996 family)
MPDPSKLTEEYVYRIAPDGQAVKAAEVLLRDAAFSGTRTSDDGAVLHALCRGSERTPYSVRVDRSDLEHLQTACDCSSWKRPCKHALGLLLLAIRSPDAFGGGAPTGAARSRRGEAVASTATPRKPTAEETLPAADVGEALLQSILAEPEDDALRLIYADWLEEDAPSDRAEFIRVQMELARAGEADPGRKALRAREKELWATHRDEWLSVLPPTLRARDTRFQKGFLEELAGPPKVWIADADAVFSRHPIHRVRLKGAVGREEAGALAVVPQLSRVRTLLLAGCRLVDPDKNLATLFATPFLSGLRRLDLTGGKLTSRDVFALAGTVAFAHVRELDLTENDIGPKGAEALAEAARMENLQELSLANNPLGDAGGKALAHSPDLERLTRLDLRGVALGKAVVAKLRERFGERVLLG